MTENDTTIELSSATKNLARKTAKVALIATAAVAAVLVLRSRLDSEDDVQATA